MFDMGSIRDDVRTLSRELRHRMTPEETRLWDALRRRTMGCRFRRQHPFGDFIFDFYCPRARLAVELDGAHHDTARDHIRDQMCASAGVFTLRFSNARVRDVLDDVLGEIRDVVESRVEGRTRRGTLAA
jgi:very-short-patch-repair endonuclease